MINIEQALVNKYPSFAKQPSAIKRPTVSFLKRLIYQNEINVFLRDNYDAYGFDFIDRVLNYFNFTYSVTNRDRHNIPATGRVVIIANHPIGSLDGLAILKLVGEVRKDVKIVANDMLSHFEGLKELIIPLDNMTGGSALRSYRQVIDSLNNDHAIIVFPAGEVSRARPTGVKDTRWLPGFLTFARKANAPILPIHISAKNSFLFYCVSAVFKPLGTALLAHEMFNKRSCKIEFSVGNLIPPGALKSDNLHDRTLVKRLKKHLYQIGQRRSPYFNKRVRFETEKTIAHPEAREDIVNELQTATFLGKTQDNNCIYLFDYKPNSAVIREIGRLREFSFRKVGEGTGKIRDLDRFDRIYRHLVLWDQDNLEIAGAYRLGEGKTLMQQFGERGFYTRTLYNFNPELLPKLEAGVELGRSFVNPAYWGKASLDYLWQGLGVYISTVPGIRYLFGPVSMSADYPRELMDMLAYFYQRYYASPNELATANHPYILSDAVSRDFDTRFGSLDRDEAFNFMQMTFREQGHRLPVLFKQYTALFEDGGFQTLVFSRDPDFRDCLDALCMTDLTKLKVNKRKRYISENIRASESQVKT